MCDHIRCLSNFLVRHGNKGVQQQPWKIRCSAFGCTFGLRRMVLGITKSPICSPQPPCRPVLHGFGACPCEEGCCKSYQRWRAPTSSGEVFCGGLLVDRVKLYRFVLNAIGNQVPYRIACMLAKGFLDEHDAAGGSRGLQSQGLLDDTRRLNKTGKESNKALLDKHGLAECQISYVNIGLKAPHPVLRVDHFLRMLTKSNTLHALTGGKDFFKSCSLFWERFRDSEPAHPVYSQHPDRQAEPVHASLLSTLHRARDLVESRTRPRGARAVHEPHGQFSRY